MSGLKILSALRKDEKGQSLVEFALVLPVLLFLVLGMLEYGWMLNAKISVTAAAREGARASSVLGEENSSQAYTVASVAANKYIGIGTLDADDITVTVTSESVTVSISYEKEPLIGIYIKDAVLIGSSVTMRME